MVRRFVGLSVLLHGLAGLLVYYWSAQQLPQLAGTAPGSISVSLPATSDTHDTAPKRRRAAARRTVSTDAIPQRAVSHQQSQPIPQNTQPAQMSPAQHTPLAPVSGAAAHREGNARPASPEFRVSASGGTATASGREPTPLDRPFGSPDGPGFQHQVLPDYPATARRRGREGVVLLRLTISETGQLSRVELLQDPGHGFASAALEAIKRSRFTPARENGRPVAVRTTLPIRFQLR